MLQLSPQSIIFVASTYVDFRKGIDGLASICKQQFRLDPMDGALFLFFNRAKNTIKILLYDGQGFILFVKRLSKGKFKYCFQEKDTTADNKYTKLCYRTLILLINNADPRSVRFAKDWKKPKSQGLTT
jgi:hypothetical protein